MKSKNVSCETFKTVNLYVVIIQEKCGYFAIYYKVIKCYTSIRLQNSETASGETDEIQSNNHT